MQLKRIQLVGFKSFVDPTSIPVLSRMNAIVGPNGCGKSNIVDAIRWVTGETSAKQLRGQSMADVIFNGTSGRKPVGKAAVELTFDNSDHRIAGEYAGFNEISIRREVERDGQSAYFINGVLARRRDLVDLFLGTGLGPRSYAIIEQGMISQLVEAKPEDMRSHLEEVAGISKYRERRRETENRIRHTQDNLDRLTDVRDELEKQLRHLQRQANAAEQYKVLQEELRLLQAQTKALQWKRFDADLQEKNHFISALVVECDAKMATLRDCETNIEKSRLQAQTIQDEKNDIQKNFYALGAEIARIEQQIQYKQEQLKQWEQELVESESLWHELNSQAKTQVEQINILNHEIDALKPEANNLRETLQKASDVLQNAEIAARQSQNNYESFQEQVSKTNQQCEIAKNNIQHIESQRKQHQDRRLQAEAQLSAVSISNLSDEIDPLTEKTITLKNTISHIQETLSQLSQAIQTQRAVYQAAQTSVSECSGDLQKQEAEYVSLAALQQATLQDHQAELRPWLEKNNFAHQKRLGKMIHVENGWELAVETILTGYLDAICVESIDSLSNAFSDFSKGQITFIQGGESGSQRNSTNTALTTLKSISTVIQSDSHLPSFLANIYVADNLSEASRYRDELQGHESIITKEGCWIGHNWLRVCKSHSSEESFLIREKKLTQLHSNIALQKEKLIQLQNQQAYEKTTLEELEAKRDNEHRLFQATTAALTETQTELSGKSSRLETLSQHQHRLQTDMHAIDLQLNECELALEIAKENVAELLCMQQSELTQRDILLTARTETGNALTVARADWQVKKQSADEWSIRLTSNEKQLAVLTQSLSSNQKQLAQLTERRALLKAQSNEVHAPMVEWSSQLQSQLANRATVENTLHEIDQRLHAEQDQLKQFESSRDDLSKSLSHLQEQQQNLRLSQQDIVTRQATLKEQLTELQFELESVLAELTSDANLSEWENKTNTVQNRINRLGPINLAAIDEFKTISERKTYLDQQHADLTEALEVLQNAIRKIDKETRHLFKDTFDKVNAHFEKLFPRIFGGGSASLALTEEDLLTTGIIVKAQPPGKRNTTIHMLSGGEKTLTAISLMFAMFQLNPAPFCVLDEVDAPLDDLNVGRYCQLIKEMSLDTQFLIISHNKVTIEAADHLMGVTMQEPGVSRIVAVSMKEAVEMAEA